MVPCPGELLLYFVSIGEQSLSNLLIPPLTPNSRSYLTHFTQPDSIIPDPHNPQDWNRYAYVRYNPLKYTDPTGHWCESGDDKPGGYCWSPDSASDSAVSIIFGKPGEGENTIGYSTGASGGVGVVVGDKKTIITAQHVYTDNLSKHNTVWIQVDGKWVQYDLADIEITTGPGDVATLTLPSDLPGDVVPADMAITSDPPSGQPIVTTFGVPTYEGGKLAGFTLYSLPTVTDDNMLPWRTPYGRQPGILNPGHVLNHGDSGGGVFYDGQLIGVNSYVDFDPMGQISTVAPLCLWYGWPC